VGASTALMTPVFPIIGFNHLVFRFATPEQRMVIHGGTSMVYFSTMVLMPNAFYYAPVLLPFAVGNGVTAGGLYLIADVAMGGPEALASQKLFGWIPLAGPLLGLSTALLVPLTYPLSWGLLYPAGAGAAVNTEVFDFVVSVCYKFGPGLSCLAATGIVSGLILDIFLRPVVLGVPGWPWQRLAGALLSATALALAALYSTSFRTQVLHVKDVDLESVQQSGGFLEWLFPTQVPCYVRGAEELCWVPTLDPVSGRVGSERRAVAVDAEGRLALEPRAEGRSRTAGYQAFEAAEALRKKAVDQRVKVYTSQRAAFFNGFGHQPIDKTSVERLSKELPIGETIMTDALVMLLSGSPQALLEKSLATLLPSLQQSGLAQRLDSSLNPLSHSWVSDLQTPEGLRACLGELALRAAQLRELLRLEAGASRGPWTAADLQRQLESAGVDLPRARAALKRLEWGPPGEHSRSADWTVMRGYRRRQRYETVGSVALVGVVAAALLGLWTARHSD